MLKVEHRGTTVCNGNEVEFEVCVEDANGKEVGVFVYHMRPRTAMCVSV
jgi:hypothetical protein